jgi:MerR family transcriptional regulator, copper efflux regulator
MNQMNPSKPLTIGQVARQADLGVETVRFYEREGLLPRPARGASSGYRQYSTEAVARLRFIRRAKELGFTLREISELLELRVDPATNRGDVKRRTAAKIADIDRKIETLGRMRQTLAKLERACNGVGGVSGCPILAAIEDEECGGHSRRTKGAVTAVTHTKGARR